MKYFLKALDNYANFRGRATLKEYWMFVLFNFIISMAAAMIDLLTTSLAYGFATGVDIIIQTNFIGGLTHVYLGYLLVIFIPSLAIVVRRMHDIGKSGWAILINLIPFVGSIWYLVLLCTASNDVGNPYSSTATKPKVSAPKLVKTSLILTLIIGVFDAINTLLWLSGFTANLSSSQYYFFSVLILGIPMIILTSTRMAVWVVAFMRSQKTGQQPFKDQYSLAFWIMLGVNILGMGFAVFRTWQWIHDGAAGRKIMDSVSILVLVVNAIVIFLMYRALTNDQKTAGNSPTHTKLILAVIIHLITAVVVVPFALPNLLFNAELKMDGLMIALYGLQAAAYLCVIVILAITKIQDPVQPKDSDEESIIPVSAPVIPTAEF
ncbi:MAG: DUF805 domain-containing protein [Anaerolineaceae bacterium]|nr:DUF805 domain-containing protein [Anaerolineaceae bacterium]